MTSSTPPTWRRTAVHAAVAAVLCAFLTFTICVSVGPLNRWTQDVAACPGADRVERDVTRGPDVEWVTRAGQSGRTGTTVAELSCTYATEKRLIGNDEAVIKGMLLSVLLGAVPGAGIVVVRRLVRPRSRSSRHR